MPENIGSLDLADTGVQGSKPPVTSALGGKSLRTKTSLYSKQISLHQKLIRTFDGFILAREQFSSDIRVHDFYAAK